MPKAMPERESTELKIFGMNGIPSDFVEMKMLIKCFFIRQRLFDPTWKRKKRKKGIKGNQQFTETHAII